MKQIIFEKAVLFLDNISQKQNFKFIKNILGEKINVIFEHFYKSKLYHDSSGYIFDRPKV